MSKTLHTHIKKFQFFPKSAIYDDDAKYRISEFNRHEATLYFIVRTAKAHFLLNTFRPADEYRLYVEIEVGGSRYPIHFSTAEMLYSYPDITNRFKTAKEFGDYCMNQWRDESRPNLSGAEKYAEKIQLDMQRCTQDKLVLDCPLKFAITKEHNGSTTISPYQLLDINDVAYPDKLEILYIGKSNDDTWQRIYNHNKWGLIEEHRDRAQQELIVYFLEVDRAAIDQNEIKDFLIIDRHSSDLSLVDVTLATEAALINYFIKEKKFNDQHVGSDIRKTEAIQRVKAQGYADMLVEVGLDGPFGNVGTLGAGFEEQHLAFYVL